MEALKPLGGHSVFLLIVQLALLLTVARAGAELAKRIGLPAVVGELAAGILLGPSFFGAYWPHAFAAVFPLEQAQFHLLEVVGTLGMVLLLLLTGLETDLRLLKNLGRAAFIASASGMVVPFASGLGLGLLMPDEYLAQPQQRMLFSLFLATAMAISAMPVIAKILMDLDLTRRNIGVVILSAGVVDDTVGWLILSLIAGAASQGHVEVGHFLVTLGATGAFLAAVAFVVYPLSRLLMAAAVRFRTPDTDLVLVVILAFLCAAVTEYIGVHAVFGAFIAGTMLRQVPRLSHETVHKLESFVFSILAPIFFGIVGLKVDLWSLGGGKMLGIVLAVACGGKLIGCTVGALWGGLRFWEAFSIAVAMNARGAMELVVATIGLSLGILNQQMFSIIVMVAILTSFMAPLGLRLTMKQVRMTDEEARRILASQSRGLFDSSHVRVLLPTLSAGESTDAAALAFGVARKSDSAVDVLNVEPPTGTWARLTRLFVRDESSKSHEGHIAALRRLAEGQTSLTVNHATNNDVASAIVDEAKKGYDLVFMASSEESEAIVGDVVEAAPCHLVLVRRGKVAATGPFKRLLVPIEGGVLSQAAVDFAVRYAESTDAEVTLVLVAEHRGRAASSSELDSLSIPAAHPEAIETPIAPPVEGTSEEQLERISRVFLASHVKPTVLRVPFDPAHNQIVEQAATGNYDLVVLGAENRAVQHRLYFGHERERIISKSPAAVAIVVPNLSKWA